MRIASQAETCYHNDDESPSRAKPTPNEPYNGVVCGNLRLFSDGLFGCRQAVYRFHHSLYPLVHVERVSRGLVDSGHNNGPSEAYHHFGVESSGLFFAWKILDHPKNEIESLVVALTLFSSSLFKYSIICGSVHNQLIGRHAFRCHTNWGNNP